MSDNLVFAIAKDDLELHDIYKLQHKVFIQDKELLKNNNKEDILKDEWDLYSYHTYCKINNQIVADGRLIKNSSIGFRVSSSLDLEHYFRSEDILFEISALAVDVNFRNKGIGKYIHYFRLKLAEKLKGNYVIASCFKENAIYLEELGFEVVVNNFEYKQYATSKSSTLLCFDLSSNGKSKQKLNEMIYKKIDKNIIESIENYINSI